MQPDYPRSIVLKLQVNCVKTQGEIALRFFYIEKRKTNQTKLNMKKETVTF